MTDKLKGQLSAAVDLALEEGEHHVAACLCFLLSAICGGFVADLSLHWQADTQKEVTLLDQEPN